MLEQWAPGNSAYNLSQAWRLEGPLDVAALTKSLNEIARRHEALRSVFSRQGERPVQIVLPPEDFSLTIQQPGPGEVPEDAAQLWLKAEARRPFDLRSGALARGGLFRSSSEDHRLVVSMHHIISDEWSFAVFQRELAEAYAAFSSGRSWSPPELPIQYGDFACWQRENLSGAFLEAQLHYWRQVLAQAKPAELSLDRPRPRKFSLTGETRFYMLPPRLTESLQALSRAQGVTLFMTLLAGFQMLLHRLSRQADVTVGSPMAGRGQVETEGLIGFFVNTHALRTDLSEDPTFAELLGRVRDVVLGAYAHQLVSLDQVIQAVRPERNCGAHPLFHQVFGLQPSPEPLHLAGLTVSPLEVDNGGSKFDWTLLATEIGHGLHLRSEYRTDLFDQTTMDGRIRAFEQLLEAIVVAPARRLSELAEDSDTETRLATPRCDSPATTLCASHERIHQWFEAQAVETPEATAVVCGEQHLTYGQLNGRANQLGWWLQKHVAVAPEVPVALCLERSLDMLVAILGVLKAGGAYVPLDPAYPAERLSFMLQDTQAPVLLTQKHLVSRLPPDLKVRVVCLDSDWAQIGQEPVVNPASSISAESAAYIIYTSGSTGQPKGVVVTHRNIVRLLKETQPWFGFTARDVWTLFHSYSFDFSVWEIWGALAYGGRLVVVPYLVSRSPSEFYRLLCREKVTVLNQTPSAFRQLMRGEEGARARPELSLRYVIFGGEALELQSLRPWFGRHGDQEPRLVNMYGITETTVHVTYRVIRQVDLDQNVGSVIGIPIPDLQLHLLDEQLQPVPAGNPGEICVGGAGVARGYLNRPELTRQRFIADPFSNAPNARLYRSGDLARVAPSGELEYLGRMDQQVKIRGFRVELGEIESALNAHPGIRESVVIAREHSPGDKRLVAYVVPKQTPPAWNELRQYLGQCLPDYMVPSLFVPLNCLPLTSNGKVDRRALPEPSPGLSAAAAEGLAPRTASEKLLAQIWRELLGINQIGIDDNFFELGGHSLLATQVVARAARALNRELSAALLFEAPTIRALGEAIDQAASDRRAAAGAIHPCLEAAAAEEMLARLEQLTNAELDELLASPDLGTSHA